MKNYIYFLFIFVVVASLLMTSYANSAPASPKVITLKVSTYLPETGSEGELIKWWGSELEKRSKGRVKVDYYFAQALVKTMDTLPAVTKGIADVQFVAHSYFPTQLPLFLCLDLVYQTDSGWVVNKSFNEMTETYPPFQKILKDNNIKTLGPLVPGPVTTGSTKPIRRLEDLKGLKIRALGGVVPVFKALGATPVAIPLPEVYEALRRGTIDGFTGVPYHLVAAFKFYEVTKYIINIGAGIYTAGSLYMNLDVWNKLPDDIKTIITQLIDEMPEVFAKICGEQWKKTTDTLLAAKAEVYSLPPEEMLRWKAQVVPGIYDDWVKDMEAKGLPGRETLNKYHELIKKYEALDKSPRPFPK